MFYEGVGGRGECQREQAKQVTLRSEQVSPHKSGMLPRQLSCYWPLSTITYIENSFPSYNKSLNVVYIYFNGRLSERLLVFEFLVNGSSRPFQSDFHPKQVFHYRESVSDELEIFTKFSTACNRMLEIEWKDDVAPIF